MSINFRKWLCKNFGQWHWLYNLCDCQRYEETPPEPEYVNRLLCSDTWLLSNIHCPTVEVSRFIKGTEPVDKCVKHKDK